MSSTRREIYPSSRVPSEVIQKYGWYALRELPSELNLHGRLGPTEVVSEHLKSLRAELNTTERVRVATNLGTAAIEDFAIAIEPSPYTEQPRLMLYILKPELLHPENC